MGTSNPLGEALQHLWMRFLPQMQERVSVLDAAARNLAAGTLAADDRAAAAAIAHKLAGVLGTFGLTDGTALAREAEQLYGGEELIDAGHIARLQAIAQQLREMIDAHA